MKRVIKTRKEIGVAEQVQGQIVDVILHPIHKGMWRFEFKVKNGCIKLCF